LETKFKEGDIVKINEDGFARYGESPFNPRGVSGTIKDVRTDWILVEWENCTYNTYYPSALDLVADTKFGKLLNFWEAREAALAGKKVRVVGGIPIYSEVDFTSNNSWFNTAFNEDWEIVEEPVLKTYWVNVYRNSMGIPKASLALADTAAVDNVQQSRLSCLEITVDKNGKLIEAKNVDTNNSKAK